MRLRLLILRYSLPAVQIVFTTGTGPAAHTKSRDSTIADLLHDVNDLVPLESADGEWGLEDYVVEVVPAADTTAAYECLHFQTCETVLREDDEVVIRALSSEELRIRRLGGRHQISGDGKHLIDGVTFGKQWLRKANRPGIVIPPRKRRRLLSAETGPEDDDGGIRQLPPPTQDYSDALVTTAGADEDEDDEDYVDEPLQIAVRADFDDADASELSDGDLQGEDLSTEVRLLLEDAADVEHAGNEVAAQELVGKQLKRKRDPDDEGDEHESAAFEGFSTPVKTPTPTSKHVRTDDENDSAADSDADSMLQAIAVKQAKKRAKNLILDDEEEEDFADDGVESSSDSDTSSSSESSSSDSDTDSMLEELAVQQARRRVLSLIQADEDDSSDESEYEASSSKKDLDDETKPSSGSDSASDSDSDSDSSLDSVSDSSGSDSDSSSTSSESDSESESVVEKNKHGAAKPTASTPGVSSTLAPPTAHPEDPTTRPTVPPGEGTAKTHNNNNRVKKRKRLNFLKEQGILSKDADFQALAAYDEAQANSAGTRTRSVEKERSLAPSSTADHAGETLTVVGGETTTGLSQPVSEPKAGEDSVSIVDDLAGSAAEAPEILQAQPHQGFEPAPKRAKLDLASSRRMLFSSLGLRTPKTPEAEQALRDKLSKSIRPAKQPSRSSAEEVLLVPPTEASTEPEDSWKDKLIIAAVECEQQGSVLTPPPFPFQQGWTKASSENLSKSKRRARGQAQYYEDNQDQQQEDQQDAFAPDLSTLASGDPYPSGIGNGSKSPAAGNADSKDIPFPADFETLPHLDQTSLLPGAVIAYKELHVDASTNYQPEISSFRVGRVSRMDEDGNVVLTLATRSLETTSERKYDEQTGERVYGKFELLSDDADNEVDDGVREILFSSMISPKLVEQSSVEVPNSNHTSGLRGGGAAEDSHLDDQYAAIPETVQHVGEMEVSNTTHMAVDDIATPRRKEISDIIKEAGFNSALDEQLLQPVPVPSDQHEHRGDPLDSQEQSRGDYPHRFRKESPRVNHPHSEDQASSELDENANAEADALASLNSGLVQSSSPIIHTQETVEYPHISQIEISYSGPHQTTDNNSHQNAQHLSPAPAVELSFAASDQKSWDNEADHANPGSVGQDGETASNQQQDSLEPLGSEVAQSQSQAVSFEEFEPEADQDESSGGRDSFLGVHGYDGHDSSYHDDDAASEDDSDDLPSMLEITSGVRRGKHIRLRSSKESQQPTRKSPRQSKKVQRSTPPSSPEPPPSSQPVIKFSQSQHEPRLSQIPPGSQVIDLTSSSSPQKDDEEFSWDGKKASSQSNVSKRVSSQATKQDNGLGKRRLLTTKKSRGYY